ncbi:venom acid phosphatase Acph-1-like [Ischnura elegans]|uniref:venom acid phosphatase Acph-1-like n=1 Tax=Ischnura elegans TaxID=197161 RepID=UPI001ED8A1C1|nr:venom acid phosphatase Acph-1-like [Ischnura elegans]
MAYGLAAVLLALVAYSAGKPVEEQDSPGGESTIIQTHVIFRHGQRTPADTYPNDPHINFSFDPVGWGQLTKEGKMQQYEQGQFLRRRYDALLGSKLTSDVFSAMSTDVDRTMMSAQLECAGLWPPKDSQVWNENLAWQPVPIRSQPLNKDTLLLVRVPCPQYHYELDRVMKEEEKVVKIMEENADLFKELTEITGMPITTPEDVQSLYNTLLAEELFNLTLPEWTKNYYPERLLPLTTFSFVLNVYTKTLQRIKGGPLIKKIITDSESRIEKGSGKKMYLYAGHDSTVANVLMALGVFDEQVPVYNIMTMIELHKGPEETYGFKVFLRNTTEHEPYPLTLKGCEHFCPMDTFKTLTNDVIPGKLDSECVVDDPTYVAPTHIGGP